MMIMFALPLCALPARLPLCLARIIHVRNNVSLIAGKMLYRTFVENILFVIFYSQRESETETSAALGRSARQKATKKYEFERVTIASSELRQKTIYKLKTFFLFRFLFSLSRTMTHENIERARDEGRRRQKRASETVNELRCSGLFAGFGERNEFARRINPQS